MPSAILLFCVGIAILVIAAQAFLNLAQTGAARWQLSPLFISLVIVSIGTTLPELTVTIAAISENDPGLALGNLVGSTITNITLIFGVSTLLNSVRIGTTKTPKIAVLFLCTCLLFIALQFSVVPQRIRALIWGAAVVLIFVFEYILALRGRLYEDKKLLTLLRRLTNKKRSTPRWVITFGLLASGVAVGVGGYITVNSVGQLALLLQISTTTLGLTLIAISTSLPEIITTLLAGKKEAKLVTGTLIGSSTLTLTLFPMILAASNTVTVLPVTQLVFLLISAVSFSLAVLFFKGKEIPWQVSISLLLLYGIFVWTSVL